MKSVIIIQKVHKRVRLLQTDAREAQLLLQDQVVVHRRGEKEGWAFYVPSGGKKRRRN